MFWRKKENGKRFFGYGTRDENGNYHIRFARKDANVKELVLRVGGENTFSLIRQGTSERVVVVEGIHDGLAVWERYGKAVNILILNGVGNTQKAAEFLVHSQLYIDVYLALDRDEAGLKAEEMLLHALKGKKIYTELIFRARIQMKPKNSSGKSAPFRFLILLLFVAHLPPQYLQ
ncbi:toprim domain-containing protein [Thermodesulfobacterium hydrogeniphilum]|uniref:toprim domain-containing protein n=1 Tax=Thermodesulfobacterium hydrogeniphilum TaxID=161156 RepID=UPI00057166BF|nr:toprim domain-containing protein [Thermodesulfobacterium hydrogeniphilum]